MRGIPDNVEGKAWMLSVPRIKEHDTHPMGIDLSYLIYID